MCIRDRLLIEQPDLHDDIKEGDEVTVVLNEHVDYNGKQYPIASLPENLMSIIQAGGLVNHNFSFNSPQGACPKCKGLGVVNQIDAEKVIPDRELSIYEGACLLYTSRCV